ncbi:LysR substrate-binding domain-containing protein [Oceanicaulis sp. LC35]|uniref:LysR substrate-binding domain-containing protein n=1 Tax=Oceanicaulis sp. LC35 TaxID=3349635 RepID=UPI003F876819
MDLEKLTLEPASTLPLNALRTFECVARHGSVTRAAAELGVTSGAVSQQVRLLEELIGAKLTVRAGRGLALTAQGRATAEMVHDAFQHLREASIRLSAHQDPGLIRLGAPGAFAARWLSPRINTFEAEHPEYRVQLVTDPTPESLHRFQLDMEIRFSEAPPQGVQTVELLSESLTPAVAPDLLKPDARRVNWRAAAEALPLVHHERTGGEPVGPSWAQWLDQRGVRRQDTLSGDRYNRHDHVLEAAAHHRGLALARRSLAEPDILSGRLVFLIDAGATPLGWGYHLLWPEGRALHTAARRLKDFLMEEARPFETPGL